MEVSSEWALLKRLEGAFGQDKRSGHVSVKAQVAAYIADFAQKLETQPDANIAIANEVTGLRKHYLEAVKANAIAKLRHARICVQSEKLHLNDKSKCWTTSLLSARLDDLAKERQHAELGIIDHHARDLQRVSKATKASSSSPARERYFLPRDGSQPDYNEIARDAQEKLRLLESAVLQARSQSRREKARLASSQSTTSVSKGAADRHQLRALDGVRANLTAWLEESLARCNTENMSDYLADNPHEEEPNLRLEDVQAAYDVYVETRKKLLHTFQRSSIQGPTMEISPVLASSAVSTRVMLPELDDPVMKQEEVARGLQSKRDQGQLLSYLDGAVKEGKTETAEVLQRLADESQLLPAYPILARSDRFKAAIQTFGGNGADQVHDQVIGQTEAWSFAANASGEATDVAVIKVLQKGDKAIEGVQENLRDLSFLKQTAGEPR